MNWIEENIITVAFIIWGLPLGLLRSRFRKMVYQTDHWSINIKPVFLKELKGLFFTLYPDNLKYLKIRNYYRAYLIIYMSLLLVDIFYN